MLYHTGVPIRWVAVRTWYSYKRGVYWHIACRVASPRYKFHHGIETRWRPITRLKWLKRQQGPDNNIRSHSAVCRAVQLAAGMNTLAALFHVSATVHLQNGARDENVYCCQCEDRVSHGLVYAFERVTLCNGDLQSKRQVTFPRWMKGLRGCTECHVSMCMRCIYEPKGRPSAVSICPSVDRSVFRSVCRLSICLFVNPSICLSVNLVTCLPKIHTGLAALLKAC